MFIFVSVAVSMVGTAVADVGTNGVVPLAHDLKARPDA
jgi:hypothetical protein